MARTMEATALLAEENGPLRICILGGTSIQRHETELLAAAIAENLATISGSISVFTEGMPGVQQAFLRGSEGLQLNHLVPEGHACSWPGRELVAGKDIKERKAIFSMLGDVYIVLEGGPNEAAQVKEAFRRGAQIIPVVRSGGAASGLFNFPKEALAKPPFASQEQWQLLRDEAAPVPSTAEAVVSIVEEVLREFPDGCGRRSMEDPASPSSPASWKPLLERASPEDLHTAAASVPSVGEAELLAPKASSATPFLFRPSRIRTEIPPATPRNKAACNRRQARDDWNTQEILLDWAVARYPGRKVRQRFDLPKPLAELSEFRAHFNLIFPSLEIQQWEDNETAEQAAQQLNFAFQCADRDGDGLVNVREMHYGLQCAYGYERLTSDAVRQLAFTPAADRLQDLMESLNEGLVSAAEVQGVLREAKMIGEGRPALLWALGAWYINVERSNSPWIQVLLASVRRWIPSDEEHHGWMLHALAKATMELPKTLPLPRRLGGELRKANGGQREETASRASQACVLMLSVLIHMFYLCMLIFPSLLFGLLIFLGSEHGDDRCPYDLDALLVWFGALGLAVLVMDCANDGRLGISIVVYILKFFLALTPLLGMAWTHSLRHKDADICGPYVFWTSKWIWSAIASCEMYVICLLGWSFHVARNHERFLRRAASGEDDLVDLGPESPVTNDALVS